MVNVKTVAADNNKVEQEDRVIGDVKFVHAGIDVRLPLKIWFNFLKTNYRIYLTLNHFSTTPSWRGSAFPRIYLTLDPSPEREGLYST